ncbi:MAG: GGDEF domain-containing protein [Gammaproteobacteria bacterium]|nr:GGDEF domain-containing protein [Gammaproteobacteria bacterium]
MSFPDGHPLLDAIVRLSAQRDQETLADSLVDAILSLTNARSASIYALGGELGHLSAKVLASNCEPIGSHITPLDARPGLRACIEGQSTVTVPTDCGHQMIHPVLEQGNVVGLMIREHAQAYDHHSDLLEGLMAIYSNQQSLLNHQQRDGLTGLYNRVALQNWMGKALSSDARAERRASDDAPLGCFAMFDIDLFKRINDSKGHLYGDEVLLVFADLMRESFRFNDLLFRYGGEEFAAVLSDTDLDNALTVLERFRETVARHKFAQLNQVTVTIGVTQIHSHLQADKLIERADRAMYYGKNHGRNQANAFEWLQQGGIAPSVNEHPQSYKLF